jgi:hypothetical protein
MTYRWLTDMDQALAAAGIDYVEVGPSPADATGASSWRTRGRPASTGQWDAQGVLCHHTASPAGTPPANDIRVILAGNAEAPGPISQLYIGRDAVLYIIAAGRANHGGRGRRPGIDTGGCADMNAVLLGIEVGNNGVGERWSDPVTDLYASTVAALCEWYGWPTSNVYMHATTGPPSGGCNSKIDPAGPWQRQATLTRETWDLNTWRAFVDEHRGGPPSPTPPDPGGDDVLTVFQCTDADAAFVGLTTPGKPPPIIEWLSGGLFAWYRDMGCPVVNFSIGECINSTLIGWPPQGDSRHTWTGAEFRRCIFQDAV